MYFNTAEQLQAVLEAEFQFRKRLTLPAKTHAPSKVCLSIVVLRAPRLARFLTVEEYDQVTPKAEDVAAATRPALHEAMLQLMHDHKCMLQGAEKGLLHAENCYEPANQCQERLLLLLKMALTYDCAAGPHVLLDTVQLAWMYVDPGRFTLLISTCNGGIVEYNVIANVPIGMYFHASVQLRELYFFFWQN